MRTLTQTSETDSSKNTSTKDLERELIKSLAGSYRVSFKFAETFAPDKDYKFYDRKITGAKELALLIEDSENKISIQHLLYVGKNHVIKHWRQDWIYENRELMELVKDHEWKKTQLTEDRAKGTWTQKVYQVDDCLRYQGYGTWVHVDGRHFWESTTDAPLPRRELSVRDDYNVLQRHSHIEVFDDGNWVIDQDNKKITRSKDKDQLVCMEKGIETFTLQNYDPQIAVDWWNKQAAFWRDVRHIWGDIVKNHDSIQVIDDEKLYMAQFELAEEFSGSDYEQEKATTAIKELLATHIKNYKP